MLFRYNEFCRFFAHGLLAVAAVTEQQSCELAFQTQTPPAAADTAVSSSAGATELGRTAAGPGAELAQWVRCPELLDLPPRGLACLQCTQPQAQPQADALAQVLLESCVRNVAVNYLVDGSFSSEKEILFRHVDALSSGGRNLTLLLYLLNGPSQRRHDSSPLPGFATTISPEEFRSKIRDDEALRAAFRARVEALVPLLRFASERGARILIVPMLEDNLDKSSFAALSALVRESLPAGLAVELGRNPCPSCSDGADGFIPDGFFEESHSVTRNISRGVITNDGEDYSLSPRAGFLTTAELARARDLAGKNGSVFILWNASRQGLSARGPGQFERQAADEREYPLPEFAERNFLLRFLRDQS